MNMEDPFSLLTAPRAEDNDDFLMTIDDMHMDEEPSQFSDPFTTSASFDLDLQLPEDSCYPLTPPTYKNSYLGDLPAMVSPDRSVSSEHSISEDELREQYNCTLRKLADSMRRSEATRFELLRQQETSRGSTPSPAAKSPNDVFMSTESRSQLWTFINAHGNPQETC